MARYIIDAHALIKYVAGDTSLGKTARAAMEDPNSELVIPAIALAEAQQAASNPNKRHNTRLDLAQLRSGILADERFSVFPLDWDLVDAGHDLYLTDLFGDMHDAQIVATALHLETRDHPVQVVTRDQKMTASGRVRICW